MKERQDWQQMRNRIIGLGEESSRRSYYPELMARLEQLEETRESLRRSEANLRTLFDSLHDAVVIHDASGRILEVNETAVALLGRPREALAHSTVYEISVGDPEVLRRHWEDVLTRGFAVFPWKVRHPLQPDLLLDVEVSLRPVHWFEQEALVAVVRDISERTRLEALLNQSQKLESLGQLAGGVAHDTNNMLGVIIGYAEILMEGAPEDSMLKEDLQQIRKAAQHSAELTRQLLAFARRQAIRPQLMDLDALLEGTQRMLRRLIGEQHTLTWLPGANPWLLWMDPAQVDQVVTNLVINARDALGPAGTITLATTAVSVDEAYAQHHPDATVGDYVVLSVTDNGHGMPPEVQARIFDPFFTTKAQGKGTGLGLATVYGIVRQNGGFISVYSSPGMGTTFRVHLPRHQGVAPEAKPNEEGPLRGHETILLVEDETALLALAQRLLEAAGYRVIGTSHPREALALADAHGASIALLATDLVMPELNGRELFEQIHARHPGIRPLFLSGYPAGTIPQDPSEGGGLSFLQKPFTQHALLQAVRRVLDG